MHLHIDNKRNYNVKRLKPQIHIREKYFYIDIVPINTENNNI